ncbi:MAG: hypothetical protein OXN16_03990 [Gammaproteobacteria bacterium]|nr:hypothetical protein [Gammaproteobacteria bacterium]
MAIPAIRLLMLIGSRLIKFLNPKWDIADRLTWVLGLRDTKTDPHMVPLTGAALTVFDGIEQVECIL